MLHPETHEVTLKHGPRPAGKPDECFYCGRRVEEEHKEDCVMRGRTVKIRVTIDYAYAVPEYWTEEDINTFYNRSSWCADNILDHLSLDNGCLCGKAAFKYIGEATAQEEREWEIKKDLRDK